LSAILILFALAAFVPNFEQEDRRVSRLLENAIEDPSNGRQYFLLDKVHARALLTLKDRVWRNAQILEICRRIFASLNRALFPGGPQPQGLFPLIDIFRVSESVKESLMNLAVLGANATMAYIRSRRPKFSLQPPAPGELISQSCLGETYPAAENFISRCRDQFFGPVTEIKNE
jgi:hypothetical protein